MSQLDINAPHHDTAIRHRFDINGIVHAIAAYFSSDTAGDAPVAPLTDAERREAKYRIREQGYMRDLGIATNF